MSKEEQKAVLEREIGNLDRLYRKLESQHDAETDSDKRNEIRGEMRRVDAKLREKRETLAFVERCTHTIPPPTPRDWADLEENTRKLEELERGDIAFHRFLEVARLVLDGIKDRRREEVRG